MAIFRRSCTLAVITSLACGPALLTLPVAGWAQIEEVIVTTRKREESLQDVPIAVVAIGSEEIDRKAINSMQDITKNLSSVEFDEGASNSDTRITIRGLSPTRGRQNVAVLVDDELGPPERIGPPASQRVGVVGIDDELFPGECHGHWLPNEPGLAHGCRGAMASRSECGG